MSGFISAGPWLQAQERPSAAAGFSSPAPWVWAASAQAQHGTPLAGYSTVWPFASVVQANQAGFASPLPLLPRGSVVPSDPGGTGNHYELSLREDEEILTVIMAYTLHKRT